MDTTCPEDLVHLFSFAIYNYIEKNKPTERTASILAETYIKLIQEQETCIKNTKQYTLPDPKYIAALGTVVYYSKH
jgi:hypothetical protein